MSVEHRQSRRVSAQELERRQLPNCRRYRSLQELIFEQVPTNRGERKPTQSDNAQSRE
jgi:hypothetical protein